MADQILAPNSELRAPANPLRRLDWGRDQIGLLLGLILLIVGMALLSAPFRRIENFTLIAQETAAIGIVAAGQTLVILTGGIDLSVGSVVGLAGVVAASLMKHGLGPIPPLPSYLAMAVALGLGAGIGLGQGYLIARRNLPPFMVTLASLAILRGVALVITNASPVHLLPDDFKWISDAQLGILPIPALIMGVVYLALGYALRNTRLGRFVYAIGSNETAARLSGVPVDRSKMYVYMISGVLAAFSGMILIARIDGGIYTNGEGYDLSSVAAVVIGGTSLGGGVGGLWGTLLGVLLLAVVRNGLVMFSISPLWHSILIGGIILVALLLDWGRRRARQAVTQVQINRAAAEHSYLDEVIARVRQLVQERLGSAYVRVYLLDREQDELIERRGDTNVRVPAASLAEEVRALRQPVILDTLDHGGRVVPLDPGAQSAIAAPIFADDELVGVVEVQSLVPKGFGADALKRLTALTPEVAIPLDDAWLLERGWLARQARDALRHLWDEVYLGQCALADWAMRGISPEGGPAARGAHLRRILMEAIANLKPEKHASPRPARRYDVIHLSYVEGHSVDEVIKELNVSRRQYFYDLKDALDALANVLVTTRHILR